MHFKNWQALALRERLSASADFAGASPIDRNLLTRVMLHFAVAADNTDELLERIFAAFHAAKLGSSRTLEKKLVLRKKISLKSN